MQYTVYNVTIGTPIRQVKMIHITSSYTPGAQIFCGVCHMLIVQEYNMGFGIDISAYLHSYVTLKLATYALKIQSTTKSMSIKGLMQYV